MHARFVNLRTNKKTHSPDPRVIFTKQDRKNDCVPVPKELARVPIPQFEDKSSGESSYYDWKHKQTSFQYDRKHKQASFQKVMKELVLAIEPWTIS